MLDSLDYDIRNGVLTVTVKGEDNMRKAIFTSQERPWANLTRADVTAIRELVEKMLKDRV